MCGNKLTRLDAELFLETFAEIRRIVEAHHVADFIDPISVFLKQGSRFFQPDQLDHFIRRNVGQPFDLGKESRTADAELFGQKIDRKLGVREIFFYNPVHLL